MDKRLTNVLLVSIIVTYSFFIFQSLERGVEFRNLIKLISSIIGPIPLFLFLYFILSSSNFSKQDFSQEVNKALSSLILVTSLILTMVLIYIYELYFNKFGDTNLPIFLNSLILSMYVLNLSRIKSINIAAFLSGMGIGISMFIVFIST